MGLVGKRDPMNGGESSNAVTCFPPYTAYQARKTQRWLQDQPTLRSHEGLPRHAGCVLQAYVEVAPDPASSASPWPWTCPSRRWWAPWVRPTTSARTARPCSDPLGTSSTCRRPMTQTSHASMAPCSSFGRATPPGRGDALIARAPITDTALSLFSSSRWTCRETPKRSSQGAQTRAVPTWILTQATPPLHTRDIGTPPDTYAPVVTVGTPAPPRSRRCDRCTPGITARRSAEATAGDGGALAFAKAGDDLVASTCSEQDDSSTFSVTVVDEVGAEHAVVLGGQRVVSQVHPSRAVPMEDVTPWFSGADLSQSLRVWMPYAANADLPPGRYRTPAGVPVRGVHRRGRVWRDGHHHRPRGVDHVHRPCPLPRLRGAVDAGLLDVLFVVRTRRWGPTDRVWWEDDVEGPTRCTRLCSMTRAARPSHTSTDSRSPCGERWDTCTRDVARPRTAPTPWC